MVLLESMGMSTIIMLLCLFINKVVYLYLVFRRCSIKYNLLTMFYLLLTDTCSMTYHLHYHKNRDPSLEA